MNQSTGWRIDERNARHVRRARLSLSTGAPRNRLVASMEEALRLASLPGENEGRAYYFRRLRVTGLPPDGDRRTWLEAFQRALTEQASQAVHGNDSRADVATAVFFRSKLEALEILLHRVVDRAGHRTASEWFWPMVVGDSEPSRLSSARAIQLIIEELRSTPAAWVAVAIAVFGRTRIQGGPHVDVVYLLDAIPISVAETWVKEMDGGRTVPAASIVRMPDSIPVRRAVEKALRVFGVDDARVVWITALAILQESPSQMAAGTVVQHARILLRQLVSECHRETASQPAGEESVQSNTPAENVKSVRRLVNSEPDPPHPHPATTFALASLPPDRRYFLRDCKPLSRICL